MEKITIASLPAEVLLEVFNKITTLKQLVQCSWVNSRWKTLAETSIHSRDVTVITEYDALCLRYFLENSPGKIQLIKHLTITPSPQQKLYHFWKLIPHVATGNLETFKGSFLGLGFSLAMLSATSDEEGLAKFKKFDSIPFTYCYNNAYDTLLYRLRYTLKEITLNFLKQLYDMDGPEWTTLYRLDEFTQLETLAFTSYIHNVKETEAILKNCVRLKRLTIRLASKDLFDGETRINQWIMANTHQCDTLKTLEIKAGYNKYMINYLMYKYPNIETVIVNNTDVCELWKHEGCMNMEMDTIRRILGKIQRVPNYTLKCNVSVIDGLDIINTLRSEGHTVETYFDQIMVTNSSSIQRTPRPTAHAIPLRVCCPGVRKVSRSIEWQERRNEYRNRRVLH